MNVPVEADFPIISNAINTGKAACIAYGVPTSMIPPFELWSPKDDEAQDAKQWPSTHSATATSQKARINVKHEAWLDPESYMRRNGPSGRGQFSTDRGDHPVLHEIGHGVHVEGNWKRFKTKAVPDDSFAKVALQVSKYAAKRLDDFVAETFAALVAGRDLSREVRSLYRALGGFEGPLNRPT